MFFDLDNLRADYHFDVDLGRHTE